MASTIKICTVCNTPTTLRCSRCIEGLDHHGEPSPTYYCSVTCQEVEWPDHKVNCRKANARKQLYRGALLVQQALYAFRESAFDVHLSRLWKTGNTIHAFPQFNVNGPLYPFPDHFQMNDEDKEAVLAYDACGMAVAYMAKLVKKVLAGIIRNKDCVTEPAIMLKPAPKTIVVYKPNGVIDDRVCEHKVVHVLLKTDEEYILDPSGAQFRQYRAAMPLSKYKAKYVRLLKNEPTLGCYSFLWDDVAKFRDNPEFRSNYSAVWVSNEIAKAVNKKIDAWEEGNGKTAVVMLNQKQALFEADKVAFLDVISIAVREWIRDWEAEGKVIPPAESREGPQT